MATPHGEEPDDTHPVPGNGRDPADPVTEPAPPAPYPRPSIAWVPTAVGVLALAGYAAFVLLLLDNAKGATDAHWLRSLHLFGSVEAIAFAAAGFLFGREVNRARAESAEDRAQRETKRAEKAETRGQELKHDLKDVADVEARAAGVREQLPGGQAGQIAALARKAERLFPGG